MSEHGSMNGAEWLARALAEAGTTHVFFVESDGQATDAPRYAAFRKFVHYSAGYFRETDGFRIGTASIWI